MTYTDSQGRPEIVAGSDLKLGPAAFRLDPPDAGPGGDQASDAGDDGENRLS